MDFSQIAQIGIGAIAVLIVLFMLIDNISDQGKPVEARVRSDGHPEPNLESGPTGR